MLGYLTVKAFQVILYIQQVLIALPSLLAFFCDAISSCVTIFAAGFGFNFGLLCHHTSGFTLFLSFLGFKDPT